MKNKLYFYTEIIAVGLLALWLTAVLSSDAIASGTPRRDRGYTIDIPGQPRVVVSPRPNGGYTIWEHGSLPVTVAPRLGGGYVIRKPGEVPVIIRPR